ncbi:uncharacterized protein METZ01_LOCUS517342, partial [marine metagenome]
SKTHTDIFCGSIIVISDSTSNCSCSICSEPVGCCV